MRFIRYIDSRRSTSYNGVLCILFALRIFERNRHRTRVSIKCLYLLMVFAAILKKRTKAFKFLVNVFNFQ